MKQLLVRNIEDPLVLKLKDLAGINGISVEEQHRRILREALNGPAVVKESIATYLVQNPVCPEVELSLDRSRDVEDRKVGL